eukprot:gene14803-17502_t
MPHNQPNGYALLPFVVAPAKAYNIFEDWYKSLWFAPTNFRERLEETLEIGYYFVPYYAFTAVVSSTHKGRIGHVKRELSQQVVVVGDKTVEAEEDEVEWTHATTNPYMQTHTDVLVYAPVDFTDAPVYEDLKEIATWKTDNTEPYHAQHPQLNNPIYEPFKYYPKQQYQQPMLQQSNPTTQQIDPKFYKVPQAIQSSTMENAWEFAQTKIKRNESYGNDQKLKRDHMAHTVSDVETSTLFVNGQNGNYHGLRPYGIGSIRNTAIKFLTAGIFEKTGAPTNKADNITPNGMIKGSDLNQVDAVLKNNGFKDITIESQKRLSDIIGGSCTLKAGESQTFAFKGTWCISVTGGDPSTLELSRVETNSGSDKLEVNESIGRFLFGAPRLTPLISMVDSGKKDIMEPISQLKIEDKEMDIEKKYVKVATKIDIPDQYDEEDDDKLERKEDIIVVNEDVIEPIIQEEADIMVVKEDVIEPIIQEEEESKEEQMGDKLEKKEDIVVIKENIMEPISQEEEDEEEEKEELEESDIDKQDDIVIIEPDKKEKESDGEEEEDEPTIVTMVEPVELDVSTKQETQESPIKDEEETSEEDCQQM